MVAHNSIWSENTLKALPNSNWTIILIFFFINFFFLDKTLEARKRADEHKCLPPPKPNATIIYLKKV